MKRLISITLSLTILICVLLTVPLNSLADWNLNGNVSGLVDFKVAATGERVYIVLNSPTKADDSERYEMYGSYTGDSHERNYRFCLLNREGQGRDETYGLLWIPSTTANTEHLNSLEDILLLCLTGENSVSASILLNLLKSLSTEDLIQLITESMMKYGH